MKQSTLKTLRKRCAVMNENAGILRIKHPYERMFLNILINVT